MNAPTRLERLRTSVRRFQLYSGLGVVALALGQAVGTALVERLAPRLESAPEWVRTALLVAVQGGAWCLVMLPLLGNVAARFFDLSPWRGALVSAGSALAALMAVLAVGFGLDGLRERLPLVMVQAALAALGVGVTARAIRSGNRVREEVDAKARAAAEARAPELAKALEAPPEERPAKVE